MEKRICLVVHVGRQQVMSFCLEAKIYQVSHVRRTPARVFLSGENYLWRARR